MATEKQTLCVMIALENGKEFEFNVIVEIKKHKEFDDYRTWEEIDFYSTEIDGLDPEEAKEIIKGEIDLVHIENSDDFNSNEDYIFGGRKEMLEMIKEIAEGKNENN